MNIGCHVPMHNSARSAERCKADVVQIHLGSPQQWQKSALPQGETAANVYIHAPYLINFSTFRPEVLAKSRATLMYQSVLARDINAKGIVFHGGSWKKGERSEALHQWQNALNLYHPTKVLVENSANGKHSLTRHLEDLADLWPFINYPWVGFCLDTAHLWANLQDTDDAEDYIVALRKIVGKIDLVHANGSSAPLGSGLDRHRPLKFDVGQAAWVRDCIVISGCQDVVAESTEPESCVEVLRTLLR